MSLPRLIRKLAVLLAPLALLAGGASMVLAQDAPAGPAIPTSPGGSCATGTCGGPTCTGAACTLNGGCAGCQKKDCPPKYIFCEPEPPKIKFKCTCPKPLCDPCNLDPTGNYGYTPTCWRPWSAPPNYSHCPVPSPTQFMPNSNAELAPVPVPVPSEEKLPPPPKLETRLIMPPQVKPSTTAASASNNMLPPPGWVEGKKNSLVQP